MMISNISDLNSDYNSLIPNAISELSFNESSLNSVVLFSVMLCNYVILNYDMPDDLKGLIRSLRNDISKFYNRKSKGYTKLTEIKLDSKLIKKAVLVLNSNNITVLQLKKMYSNCLVIYNYDILGSMLFVLNEILKSNSILLNNNKMNSSFLCLLTALHFILTSNSFKCNEFLLEDKSIIKTYLNECNI